MHEAQDNSFLFPERRIRRNLRRLALGTVIALGLIAIYSVYTHRHYAITIAVEKRWISALKSLLEAGLDPGRAPAPYQTSSLFAAAIDADKRAALLLLQHGLPSTHPTDDLVGQAVRFANDEFDAGVSLVDELLKRGAPLNGSEDRTSVPLFSALKRPVFEWLLDRGADVRRANKGFGETVLHTQVGWCHADIAIARGAGSNARDLHQQTPLHDLAAYASEFDKAREQGDEPWRSTCPASHEVAALLLKAGADPNARDYDGKTPLDYAAQNKAKALQEVLRKHGGKHAFYADSQEAESVEQRRRDAEDLQRFAQIGKPSATRCALDLHGVNHDVMAEGNSWVIPLGTEAKLFAGCGGSGFLHYFVDDNGGRAQTKTNIPVAGRPGEVATLSFETPWDRRPMYWFHSAGPVTSLVEGIRRSGARRVATVTVTVAPLR